ncbi:hypothetical protein ES703_08488 [subsurface metagenome]
MLFMEMVELLGLMDRISPSEVIKATNRVFQKVDLPARVEGDYRANLHRVEVFTRALFIELIEGEKKP